MFFDSSSFSDDSRRGIVPPCVSGAVHDEMMGGLDLNHSSDIQAVKLIKEILLGVVALVDAAEEGEEMEGSINDVGIKKMLLMSLIINK